MARPCLIGYLQRAEFDKKVYKLGKVGQEYRAAQTEFDRTQKDIPDEPEILNVSAFTLLSSAVHKF